MPLPEAQINNELARLQWVEVRMGECPVRRATGCGLIEKELGWKSVVDKDTCDRCFSCGGMSTPAGEGVRASYISNQVAIVISAPTRYAPGVLKPVISRHVPRDQALSLLSQTAFILGRESALELAVPLGGTQEITVLFDSLTPHELLQKEAPATRWGRVRDSWAKAESYLKSEASALVTVVEPKTLRLRTLSCFGTTPEGIRVAQPCPSLRPTSDGRAHFCNDCGCGEKNKAIIRRDGTGKLTYPYLECPRGRPGFSNQVERTPDVWLDESLDIARTFDRVVCINMDRRQDRRKKFLAGLPSDWPLRPVDMVRAVDGNLVPVPLTWGWGGGTWGCARSHVRVLEDALLSGVDTLLVFEDDATFVPDFAKKLRTFLSLLPPEWDGLMLGGQHMKMPVVLGNGLVQCVNTQRTHAYAVRGPYIKKLYREWVSKGGHVDHIMGPLHASSRVYAPSEMLVLQGADHSDICNRTFTEARSWDWKEVIEEDRKLSAKEEPVRED